jgi:hypothetical protein
MTAQNNGNNGDGRCVIAQTGVRQCLSSVSIPCVRADLRALSTNTADVVIGGNTVSSSPISGIPMHPDEAYDIDLITDAINIIVVGTAGDVITYTWWTGNNV